MIRVISPQCKLIAEIEANDVPDFLRVNQLVGRSVKGLSWLVAFDHCLESEILAVESETVPLLPLKGNPEEVAHRIRSLLEEGNDRVVVRTPRHVTRGRTTLAGFSQRMEEVGELVQNGEVYIPAGLYGSHYLFGMMKKW